MKFLNKHFFARSHFVITADDDAIIPQEQRVIYCGTDGDIAVKDEGTETTVVYTVTAGDILPVRCIRVMDTDTTVTQIIGLGG